MSREKRSRRQFTTEQTAGGLLHRRRLTPSEHGWGGDMNSSNAKRARPGGGGATFYRSSIYRSSMRIEPPRHIFANCVFAGASLFF